MKERERAHATKKANSCVAFVRPSEGQSRKVGQSRMAAVQWNLQEMQWGVQSGVERGGRAK